MAATVSVALVVAAVYPPFAARLTLIVVDPTPTIETVLPETVATEALVLVYVMAPLLLVVADTVKSASPKLLFMLLKEREGAVTANAPGFPIPYKLAVTVGNELINVLVKLKGLPPLTLLKDDSV